MAKKTIRADELGLRLYAAVVSYQIGRVGVDSTLAHIRETLGPLDPSWDELGMALLRIVNNCKPDLATMKVPHLPQ